MPREPLERPTRPVGSTVSEKRREWEMEREVGDAADASTTWYSTS